jgi:hypothetical protein
MNRFVAAVAVLLACLPLTFLIGAVVLELSGENWASWSAGPNGWGVAAVADCSGVRLRGPDRRAAPSRLRFPPQVDQSAAWERRRGSDRRQALGAT